MMTLLRPDKLHMPKLPFSESSQSLPKSVMLVCKPHHDMNISYEGASMNDHDNC